MQRDETTAEQGVTVTGPNVGLKKYSCESPFEPGVSGTDTSAAATVTGLDATYKRHGQLQPTVVLSVERNLSLPMLVAAVLVIGSGGAVGVTTVPTVGLATGIFTGAFLLGAVAEQNPLVEAATAALAVQLGMLAVVGIPGGGVTEAAVVVSSVSVGTLALSLATTAIVGALGAHFGHDLRDGIITPIDAESRSRDQISRQPKVDSAEHRSPGGSSSESDSDLEREKE